jgi:hypothetical protein
MQALPKLGCCQQLTDSYPGVTVIVPEDQILPSLLSQYEETNDRLATHRERYGKISEDSVHFDRSHSNNLKGAAGLKGAALIVGIGNATDIPFNELAKQFDKVTVVEIDPKSIGRALSKLDKDLLKKITVVVADLTGCMEAFSKEVESVRKSTQTPEAFLKGLITAMPSLKPKTLAALGEKQFDYVVSHLVLTQLGTIPLSWVEQAAKNFSTSEPSSDIPNAPVLTFVHALQCQHMRDLHRWANESAKVYVADTYANYVCIRLEPREQPILYGTPSSSIASAIQDIARELFKLKEMSKPWVYYNCPPAHEKNAPGTAHVVQAYLYERLH